MLENAMQNSLSVSLPSLELRAGYGEDRSEQKITRSTGCLITLSIWVICWISIWSFTMNTLNFKTF